MIIISKWHFFYLCKEKYLKNCKVYSNKQKYQVTRLIASKTGSIKEIIYTYVYQDRKPCEVGLYVIVFKLFVFILRITL